jgi:type IV pilus assembly protein PilC
VLPKIAGVYESMGSDLPWLTKVLIRIGKFMVLYGDIFVPIFISIIFIILYFLFSFPKTKFVGHLILFHLPLIKKLIRESEITRFGVLMGNITKAGLPINRAFEIMPGTTTFKNYKKLYAYLGERVSEGICLSEALKSYKKTNKLIPSSVLQMINSAEKSGKLGETFLRIGVLYGNKLENTSKNIPIIIEPILLLLVGLGVALFVLATMLPIYNLGDIIK